MLATVLPSVLTVCIFFEVSCLALSQSSLWAADLPTGHFCSYSLFRGNPIIFLDLLNFLSCQLSYYPYLCSYRIISAVSCDKISPSSLDISWSSLEICFLALPEELSYIT